MNQQISLELKSRHFAGTLAFLALLLAFNQPWSTSMDGDSIVYATISRTIAEGGNWLTPVYNFRNFFDHPPLVFWVNALLFKLLGPGEWVAKLFSGFCGLGAVLLVYHIGRRYGNFYLGFYAALSMLLTYDFTKYLNKCRLDMPLVLFFACGLYSFLRGLEGEKKGFYLCGLFAGLAFFTKGIVAAGIFLISLLLLVDLKKLSFLKKKEIWFAAIISVAVPGLWVAAQYHANGPEFFERYFLEQVRRSIQGRDRPYGPFYYSGHLIAVYWPWLPFLFHGIALSVRDKEKHPLWRMALLWCGVVFIAFSLARFKIHYYLLPMFPAMALLAGRSLDRTLSDGAKLAGFKLTAAAGVLAAFFLAVSPLPLHHNRYPEIYKMAPYMKELLKEDDLIIAYRNQEGITTPSLYLVNPRLRIVYCREPHELREILQENGSRRIIIYTSDRNVQENPTIIKGFHPFLENNGMRFYSMDPGVKLSGRIY
ncbi:MAG: glycosyltransferase family 39 protein [Nitrospinae bacterium]|nr:glycosyltransferase family 39 protein [Nitrospinota bacterium]